MAFSSRAPHHQDQRVQSFCTAPILPQAWADSSPLPSYRVGKAPALFFEPREGPAPKALCLAMPPKLLALADEPIE
jgi:hypothetical protein